MNSFFLTVIVVELTRSKKMDRSKAIEHILLSRCYKFQNDEQITKILEDRYTISGSQKNFIVLEPTGGAGKQASPNGRRFKKKKKCLFTLLKNPTNQQSKTQNNKHNPLKTKNEFKSFIKQSLQNQDNITRKLKQMAKKDPNVFENDVCKLHICDSILKFEDFIEMNSLWNDYIKDLLANSLNSSVITTKLSTCEFIGAYLEVIYSSCPDNIGMAGIVIWESQNSFVIVVPRKNNWKENISKDLIEIPYSAKECIGGLRVVPKKHSRFLLRVEIDDGILEFEVLGDRIAVRSVDRANKKFKSHNVKDIDL